VEPLRRLAEGDAFGSMGITRQQALWTLQRMRDDPLPLFDGVPEGTESKELTTALPVPAPTAEVGHDYRSIGLSLKAHPISFLRDRLKEQGVTPNAELAREDLWPGGRTITVAGIVLVRQRPGTASGILFMTLEDETGIANLIVRPHIYDRYRRAARHSSIILCRGTVERQGAVVHVLAKSIHRADDAGTRVPAMSRDFH
jgi:error-prone DNA polymerase